MKSLSVLLALAIPLPAAWTAGVGRYEITPNEPVWMAGYGSRVRPMEGVRQSLWAKALAIRDSAGHTAVIVTLDLCDIDGRTADEIAADVQRRAGVPRESIAFNTSHTHSGPIFGDPANYLHLMGPDPRAHVEAIRRYTEFARTGIAQAILNALGDMQPVEVQFGSGFAGFAVNRRRAWKRELPGPVDHDVPVLAVRGRDGQLLAAAVGYSCHNTVMGDYLIHGDYAGYFQEAFEKRHPGATALFVQGTGGDANPLPRRTEALARAHGETLADAADEVLAGRMKKLDGELRVEMKVIPLKFQMPSRAMLEARAESSGASPKRHARRLLEQWDRDGKLPESHPYPVQVWRFGTGLTMVMLGGEVVADYSLRIKPLLGWDSTWVAGYSNDVFAYIPSLRILRERGYEGETAMEWDGHPGPFTEDVEEAIIGTVARMTR